jgi:DNA-binding PadR family transcriptional regulator
MPRTKTPPTAAEYAVLALLSEEPAHGYAIAQHFASGGDLSLLYSIEQSSVYDLLKELQQNGLISGHQEVSGLRPPRTVLAITAAGEARLQAWLGEPVEPLHRLRLDFLLKLHFLTRRSRRDAASLIAQQLSIGERYLQELDEQLAALDPDSLEHLVIESKQAAVRSFVTWLGSRRRRLETAVR